MASNLRITFDGAGEIDRLLRAVNPSQNRDIANHGLTRIILHLQKEVTSSSDFIVHGRGDADPLPDKLTSRHGGSGLVGSITPDFSGLPRLSSLGSDLPYAGVHEDSRRAYLAPTYDKAAAKGRLAEIMLSVIETEMQQAGAR